MMIIHRGISCDRCGEVLVLDGTIQNGYVIYRVYGEPESKHYLCAMCNQDWAGYYLVVGWELETELLTIDTN